MSQDNFLSKLLAPPWKFLGFFQSPFLRILHTIVVVLIFLQLLSTFVMEPLTSIYYESGDIIIFSNMYHYISGITILLLIIIMIYTCIANKGLRHYFPYLYFDFSTLRKDVKAMLTTVPRPAPKGMSSCIQGFGLIIFLLAALSGLIWFILYMLDAEMLGMASYDLMEYHYLLVTPIYLYILIHGVLSISHFVVWLKKVNANK